jgi:hypothetical protein
VPRCWSEGDSNRRSSLAFSPLEEGPKSGSFSTRICRQDRSEDHSLIGFSAVTPPKNRAFRKVQEPQRGPAVRIPFAPPTRHCEPRSDRTGPECRKGPQARRIIAVSLFGYRGPSRVDKSAGFRSLADARVRCCSHQANPAWYRHRSRPRAPSSCLGQNDRDRRPVERRPRHAWCRNRMA